VTEAERKDECLGRGGKGETTEGDNRATSDQMFDLLQDISMAGVELDDRRMSYVVVQIDRAVWQRVQGYKPGDPECQEKLAREKGLDEGL